MSATVPVGTAEKVRAVIAEELAARGKSIEFSVVSNPEFLKEGAAVDDFMRPDRIVIGATDERAKQIMRAIYAPIQRNHERMIVMDIPSAELTKYAANAMLATRISFMNELANLAEKLGADIEHVRQGIGSDARIGYHFLYAGCGYGGACFPKDVSALQQTAQESGMHLNIIDAVERSDGGWKNTHLIPVLNVAANMRQAEPRLIDLPSRILLRYQGRAAVDSATILADLERLFSQPIGGAASDPAAATAADSTKTVSQAVFAALLWIPYLQISKRVKSTFVR